MSQTKLETQLGITHLHGNFDMTKLKITLLILAFAMLLISTAWGQNGIHSIGNGPSFTVYPAIAIAGSDGHFQFNIVSENPNIKYEVLLNGKKVVSHGKLREFKSKLPFDKLYSYLVVKSIGRWESSSATILVLSPKLKKMNAEKKVSISTIPRIFGYKSTESGTLVTVLNAGFGRESLKISLDGTTLMSVKLSLFSNSPKVFETSFNTKKLANGKHLLKAQLLLITGEKLIATTTIIVQNYFAPPVIQSFEVSPRVVKPQKVTLTASVVVKDKTGVKSVKINGVSADYRDGEWIASIPIDFSKIKIGEATNVSFTVDATNNFNKSTEKRFSRKISVRGVPPAPTNLHTTSVSQNSISIAWNASPGASDYKIYRSTNGQHFSQIAETSSINYTDSSLNLSTTYYYKVKAINAYGESGYSNVVKATTLWIWWWLIGIFASIMVLLLFTIY